MAKAKIKPECSICYEEEGSYGCVRAAHEAYRKGEKPVTKDILATSITQISDAVTKLYDSGLNRRAIVALINDDTKLGKGAIEAVLDSLHDLRKTYTK